MSAAEKIAPPAATHVLHFIWDNAVDHRTIERDLPFALRAPTGDYSLGAKDVVKNDGGASEHGLVKNAWVVVASNISADSLAKRLTNTFGQANPTDQTYTDEAHPDPLPVIDVRPGRG